MAKNPEYPRLNETNLAELEVKRNGWLGATPHFEDDTELLTSYQLQILHNSNTVELPSDIEAALQVGSAYSVLDRRLSTHANPRSVEFVSKENALDVEAKDYIRKLWALQEERGERGYPLRLTKKIVKNVNIGVSQVRERRTRSLIEEFKDEFHSLGELDVWMRTAQMNGAAVVRAAQLVDFAIYGSGNETVIEPVVLGLDDTRGLLPADTLYVKPHLNIRF